MHITVLKQVEDFGDSNLRLICKISFLLKKIRRNPTQLG